MKTKTEKPREQRYNFGNVALKRTVTDADKELIERIVTEYRLPSGGVGLAQAFLEHPEWKQALKHLKKGTLSARVYFIRNKIFGRDATASSKRGIPHNSRLRLPGWEEENVLIEQIVRKYLSSEGAILWKTAYREHPEWEAALSHLAWSTLYSRGNSVKKRFARYGTASTEPLQTQTTPQTQSMVVAQPPAPVLGRPRKMHLNGLAGGVGEPGTVCYCPRCGEHIKMWEKVAEVVKGL